MLWKQSEDIAKNWLTVIFNILSSYKYNGQTS